MNVSKGQRRALEAIAAGEAQGRPAQISDHTTPAGAPWPRVHYRTARNLIDRGLARDELRHSGDGLYLTPPGRTALNQVGAA